MGAELWWILCENFQIFFIMAMGFANTNFTFTVNRPTLKPLFSKVQTTEDQIYDFSLIAFREKKSQITMCRSSANRKNFEKENKLVRLRWVDYITGEFHWNIPISCWDRFTSTDIPQICTTLHVEICYYYTVNLVDLENPYMYLLQESWWYLIYKLSYSRFCVEMKQLVAISEIWSTPFY